MEILFSQPIDIEDVANVLAVNVAVGMKRKPPPPRNKAAWHVTNLIESAKLISQGDNQYYEFDGPPLGIMSMGRVWESAIDCYLARYAARHNGIYVPDVEQEEDGIVASLDGMIHLPDTGWMVCETKLRFSLNDEIPMKHLQQVRAYCHLAKTDLVCYVSGHIDTRPPTVTATTRVIRLTQQSIEETWQMLVNTRDYLVKLGILP